MKKGFTLIELLAVIVILAIIALIATPIILGIIQEAKKEAFKDTVYGIIDASKIYASNAYLKDNSFNGKTFTFPTTELKFDGEMPTGGSLQVTKDGKTKVDGITNGTWCAYKEFNESKVRIEKCASQTNNEELNFLEGTVVLNSIEDLMTYRNKSNTYEVGTATVLLGKDLDFQDDASYEDPTTKKFGDVNNDGVTEGLKKELTTGKGMFLPILFQYDIEIDNYDDFVFGKYANSEVISRINDYATQPKTPQDKANDLLNSKANTIDFETCSATSINNCYIEIDKLASEEIGIEPYDPEFINGLNFEDESSIEETFNKFMEKYIQYYEKNSPKEFPGFTEVQNQILGSASTNNEIKTNIQNYINTNKLDSSNFDYVWKLYEEEKIQIVNILNYYIIEDYMHDYIEECMWDIKENNPNLYIYESDIPHIIRTENKSSFDGQGHSIKNYYSKTSGLFDVLIIPVSNLKLENVNIIQDQNLYYSQVLGSLANSSTNTIDNVHVTGKIESNINLIGGIVGNSYGTIKNCTTNLTINSLLDNPGYPNGGIAYLAFNIENCTSSGQINGTNISGGIVGYLGVPGAGKMDDVTFSMKSCSSTVTFENEDTSAGLAYGASNAIIENSSYTGNSKVLFYATEYSSGSNLTLNGTSVTLE